MKCFYHKVDLDGQCAGAIIYKRYPECEMIGINYNDKFPWDTIKKNEKVFMVDFSLNRLSANWSFETVCLFNYYNTSIYDGILEADGFL